MRVKYLAPLIAVLAATAAQVAVAASTFDVTFAGASQGEGQAAGTSNGINWSMTRSFMSAGFCPEVAQDQSYTGFSNSAFFNPAVATTDCLHIFSQNLELTFAVPIGRADFYLKENGGNSTLDFGLPWTLVSGEVTQVGTTGARPSTNGGIIRFIFATAISTLTHQTTIFDGMNAAWFVEAGATTPPPTRVPEPGTLALLGLGLAGLGLSRRRKA